MIDTQSDQVDAPECQSGTEKVHRFTEQSVLDVHEGITGLLKQFAAQHGLRLAQSKCKYNTQKLSLTLTLEVPDSLAAEEAERIEFGALAPIFDLTAEDYLSRFTVNGRRFTLIGFKPNNRKYPIIGADESGRRYKFDVSVIEELVATES